LTAWEDITPIARNEWICWVESVKKEETRRDHVERTAAELVEGKRRPCCWIGCIHRTDKPLSPSVAGCAANDPKRDHESRSKTADLHNELRKRLSALHR